MLALIHVAFESEAHVRQVAAMFYALIGTCFLQGIKPRQYLREVVGRLDDHLRRRGLLASAARACRQPQDQPAHTTST